MLAELKPGSTWARFGAGALIGLVVGIVAAQVLSLRPTAGLLVGMALIYGAGFSVRKRLVATRLLCSLGVALAWMWIGILLSGVVLDVVRAPATLFLWTAGKLSVALGFIGALSIRVVVAAAAGFAVCVWWAIAFLAVVVWTNVRKHQTLLKLHAA